MPLCPAHRTHTSVALLRGVDTPTGWGGDATDADMSRP